MESKFALQVATMSPIKNPLYALAAFSCDSVFAFRDSTKMHMWAAYLKIKAHQNSAFRRVLFLTETKKDQV